MQFLEIWEMMGKDETDTTFQKFLFSVLIFTTKPTFWKFFHHCAFQERSCTFQGLASGNGSFSPLCKKIKNNQCDVVLPPPLEPR